MPIGRICIPAAPSTATAVMNAVDDNAPLRPGQRIKVTQTEAYGSP